MNDCNDDEWADVEDDQTGEPWTRSDTATSCGGGAGGGGDKVGEGAPRRCRRSLELRSRRSPPGAAAGAATTPVKGQGKTVEKDWKGSDEMSRNGSGKALHQEGSGKVPGAATKPDAARRNVPPPPRPPPSAS